MLSEVAVARCCGSTPQFYFFDVPDVGGILENDSLGHGQRDFNLAHVTFKTSLFWAGNLTIDNELTTTHATATVNDDAFHFTKTFNLEIGTRGRFGR